VADAELRELGIHRDSYPYDFNEISRELLSLRKRKNFHRIYDMVRAITADDLFFLLYFVLDFKEVNDPFVLARIYEVQKDNDKVIDLWPRGHFKSSIKTYAYPIWRLIKNPEERVVLFSNTKALSIGHMRRIKTTLETNELLINSHPDIFYAKPSSQAEKWSEEVGLYVKRRRNYQEASIEAWGLVDFLPTGKHFTLLIYDDIIDARNVNTQSQIEKATFYFGMSLNLVSSRWEMSISGTRYSLKDSYSDIMKKKKIKVREYAAEVDELGHRKRGGKPVMMTREELEDRHDNMGSYIYSSQILQHPVAESSQKFNRTWLRFYTYNEKKPIMYYYILVDPATKKRKESDYTVMMVVGTDGRRRYWLIDMVRDKLDLGERWNALSGLVKDWGVTEVGYEQYGAQADVEFMERMMMESGIFFTITELGGQTAKEDRIKKLVPDFQRGRWMIPDSLIYKSVEKESRDIIVDFIDEFENWVPGRNVGHDDMLDCMARIYELKMNVIFPNEILVEEDNRPTRDPLNMLKPRHSGSWMSE